MNFATNPREAEAVLAELASVFFRNFEQPAGESDSEEHSPNVETRYRAFVEQIPAVVFMAYLDRGIGEAYVSPQIEKSLGFSQREWLEDPVRWYQQIHPDDKDRWSVEAAQMFLSGQPLRSAYRVISRDGRVIWFHCEAKMIRRSDGRPWFIHGVAFDITELKQTEAALEEERNVLSAILDTVGALVVVLDPHGHIVQFNRTSEHTSGYTYNEVQGMRLWDLFQVAGESDRFRAMFEQLTTGAPV
jgi:PAS domain S-box-containing protein